MSTFLAATAVILLVTICAGLARAAWGPTPSDRLMAAQLLGTTGIALLLVLAPLIAVPALVDVALIFALLASVAAAAFTRRRDPGEAGS
jgi:multicomponent Na+:H+ antiporter subunit F